MMMDHLELSNLIMRLGKKLNVKPNEPVTIDELAKKVINRDLNYETEDKCFDITEPSLISSFFINNVDIDVDKKLLKELNKDFDLDLLVKITQANSEEYELIDYNRKKVRVPLKEVTISMKENIPFELFMKLL